jgi:hypothetical protein
MIGSGDCSGARTGPRKTRRYHQDNTDDHRREASGALETLDADDNAFGSAAECRAPGVPAGCDH